MSELSYDPSFITVDSVTVDGSVGSYWGSLVVFGPAMVNIRYFGQHKRGNAIQRPLLHVFTIHLLSFFFFDSNCHFRNVFQKLYGGGIVVIGPFL